MSISSHLPSEAGWGAAHQPTWTRTWAKGSHGIILVSVLCPWKLSQPRMGPSSVLAVVTGMSPPSAETLITAGSS